MRHRLHRTREERTGLSTFLDELWAVGTLTDDHDTEYDGGHYVTPSLIDHDDGKENPAPNGDHANPIT